MTTDIDKAAQEAGLQTSTRGALNLLMDVAEGKIDLGKESLEKIENVLRHALQQQQCPHIRTSDGGTSWCALAEMGPDIKTAARAKEAFSTAAPKPEQDGYDSRDGEKWHYPEQDG